LVQIDERPLWVTIYWAIFAQLLAMGGGLGLLVPPLASTLLGSVEKARSGVAAGVLNSTRQTGSVLGVALFGSLIGQENAFLLGARANDLCVVACWGSGRDHNWRTHKEIRPRRERHLCFVPE
jgi:hypothetical protein